MSFLQDEGAKRFYLYLTAVLAAATIFVAAIWRKPFWIMTGRWHPPC